MSEKKRIRVYYHKADLDGLCSGAIAYRHYGDQADYYGVDYGDPLDLDPTLDLILFVDFAPDRPTDNMIVLDHHKTSIGLPGVIDMDRAACEIVWDYFNPSQPRPLAVQWIAAADVFRQMPNWNTAIVPFCLALQTSQPDIKNQVWPTLFKSVVLGQWVEAGRHMLDYSKVLSRRLYEQQAYETYFHGYVTTVLIGGESGMHRFMDDCDSQVMVVAQYRANRRWYYSLRSKKGGPDVTLLFAYEPL